jgi:hypothetical protein
MVVGDFIAMGIGFFLLLPYITSRLALRQGRDPKRWFIAGFFLPLIATLILFLLPENKDQ